MDKNFIKTTDKETANKLMKLGFHCVYNDGNIYEFINDSSITMNFDNSKISYTNILNI